MIARHYAPKAETSRSCVTCGQDFTPPLLTKTVYPYGPGTRRYVVYFRSVRRTCGERCRRQLTSDSQPHRVYAA